MTVAARVRMLLVSIWVAVSLWLGSNVGLSIEALMIITYGGAAVLLAWLIRLGAHLYWKSRMPQWWTEPAAVLLVVCLVATGAAFRMRFALSRPALERYVQSTLRSGAVQERKRVQVGLFRVRETQTVSADCVRLITTSCMFDDCGVAFSPKSQPPKIERDTYQPMGGGWWTWNRSW